MADFLDFIPIVGPILNGIFGSASQSSANEANMELAQYQYQKSLEMWNMNNQYNTPSNQMARLKAAGLNPNLVYGHGSVVGNTSGSYPEYKAPNIAPIYNSDAISQAANAAYFAKTQLEERKANINLANTQRDVANQEVLRKAADTAESVMRTARSKFELDLAKDLRTYSIDAAKANVQKTYADIDNVRLSQDIKKAELELYPLKKQLTKAQFDNLVSQTSRTIWELEQEKEGRFIGHDFWSVIGNQVLRKMRGEPNMFDSSLSNPNVLKKKIEGELKAKANLGYSKKPIIGVGVRGYKYDWKVPKGGI